ncbi:glycosyltransferase [Okeania sp.]|uniref:glycosyltransferase n=1 Tax=Okeania sp. TaxID=3100323 RepID=UPI002B4B72D5|nr:glycosyltransferase [Okeania sp.]MEB3342546.1 glycosyltransferase [Okeania sp.]
MLDFTVAIPTYNGASKLPLVLEKLRSQINTENISWEVIVVDNNSNDNIREVLENLQANLPENIPLNFCEDCFLSRWVVLISSLFTLL